MPQSIVTVTSINFDGIFNLISYTGVKHPVPITINSILTDGSPSVVGSLIRWRLFGTSISSNYAWQIILVNKGLFYVLGGKKAAVMSQEGSLLLLEEFLTDVPTMEMFCRIETNTGKRTMLLSNSIQHIIKMHWWVRWWDQVITPIECKRKSQIGSSKQLYDDKNITGFAGWFRFLLRF